MVDHIAKTSNKQIIALAASNDKPYLLPNMQNKKKEGSYPNNSRILPEPTAS